MRSARDEPYQFHVRHNDGGFSVSMPHQCDRWEILGWENYEGKSFEQYPATKEEALDLFSKFLLAAQAAYKELEAL